LQIALVYEKRACKLYFNAPNSFFCVKIGFKILTTIFTKTAFNFNSPSCLSYLSLRPHILYKLSNKEWWGYMGSRADEIRKRMAKRKKERERIEQRAAETRVLPETEELYGFDKLPSYEPGSGKSNHPLFQKEIFIFKILASACLVLIVAIVFRSETDRVEPVKDFVKNTMETEFQFAAVSNWYEDQFGKPLALLPVKETVNTDESQFGTQYALPASGRILEDFGDNGQKITIETGKDAPVEAMNEGLVTFVGTKEGFGNTVIIQHSDKSDTWYGNLADFDVNVYQYIDKGASVGKASAVEGEEKGTFYFAIKKGDDFIDPIGVIKFE
jgi:stage IV sporulation protein FA